MGHSVRHVGRQHGQRTVHHLLRAGWPGHIEPARLAAHDPVGGDDVVEVADVVAVQVGEKHSFEHDREDAGRHESHADAAPGIDQELPGACADEGGGAGPVGIREWVARSEQDG